MNTLQAALIFIGLSLDSFVVMMQKGATIRGMKFKDLALYALIFSITNVISVLLGYAVSLYFKNLILDGRIEISVASLIIFSIGIFLMTKSYKSKTFVEHLDKGFDLKGCMKLAAYTSIDTLFLGAGFSFLGLNMSLACAQALVVTFISVFTALLIGYNLGAAYTKAVGMCGGALMIVFALFIMSKYVLTTL